MSNYVRNFDVKNYWNQTTIPQLIANNMSGCFFSETRCILFRFVITHAFNGRTDICRQQDRVRMHCICSRTVKRCYNAVPIISVLLSGVYSVRRWHSHAGFLTELSWSVVHRLIVAVSNVVHCKSLKGLSLSDRHDTPAARYCDSE